MTKYGRRLHTEAAREMPRIIAGVQGRTIIERQSAKLTKTPMSYVLGDFGGLVLWWIGHALTRRKHKIKCQNNLNKWLTPFSIDAMA